MQIYFKIAVAHPKKTSGKRKSENVLYLDLGGGYMDIYAWKISLYKYTQLYI